nr:MAG TPA: hypothetical protein [Bacteriophage sp.]
MKQLRLEVATVKHPRFPTVVYFLPNLADGHPYNARYFCLLLRL